MLQKASKNVTFGPPLGSLLGAKIAQSCIFEGLEKNKKICAYFFSKSTQNVPKRVGGFRGGLQKKVPFFGFGPKWDLRGAPEGSRAPFFMIFVIFCQLFGLIFIASDPHREPSWRHLGRPLTKKTTTKLPSSCFQVTSESSHQSRLARWRNRRGSALDNNA